MAQDDERRLQYCRELGDIAAFNGHRYLVILAGQPTWSRELMAAVLATAAEETPVLSGEPRFAAGRARSYLGREFPACGIDAHSHSALNEWLALAGTLRAGGLLVMACPELAQWAEVFAAQQRSDARQDNGYFISRFLQIAAASNAVKFLRQDGPLPPLPQRQSGSAWRPVLPHPDQQRLIREIKRVKTGRTRRPLVITADRGRGKSAALGLAAAELVAEGQARRILLVASREEAVATALMHFKQSRAAAEGELVYLPLEAALDSDVDEWDLVMVDEAAQLSVAALTQLTGRFPRIVFSTTVVGYEGSGRGFEIRFGEKLRRLRPQMRRATLNSPLRWAADDPLEAFLNRAFILDGEAQEGETGDVTALQYRWLTGPALAEDEMLLRQVFGLLVQAHYQTTPADLQFLLDAPIELLVAQQGGVPVAVSLCVPEGEVDAALSEEVVAGRRRPRGHLAAQRLAHHFGQIELLTQLSWRVHRIAVMPRWRRCGLGSRLLAEVERVARRDDVQFLTSSFALEPGVLRFWCQAGYSPAYLGSRRDAASGSYSLIVSRAVAREQSDKHRQLAAQFSRDLPLSLSVVYPRLPPEGLQQLLQAMPPRATDPADRHRVQRYLAGELTFEQCAAALGRLLQSGACLGMMGEGAPPLLARLLLGWGWQQVNQTFGFGDRRRAEAAFRIALGAALQALTDQSQARS